MQVNDSIYAQAQAAKLLTIEEEQNLFALAKEGNTDAVDQIFKSHLRFVIAIARKLSHYNVDIDDLIQIGSIGLFNAIKGYTPEHGVRFSSYAKRYIRGDMLHAAYNYGNLVKIVTTKEHVKLFFNMRKHMEPGKKLPDNKIKEIADLYQVSIESVVEMEQRLTSVVYSVDAEDDNEVWGSLTKPTDSPEKEVIEEERRELVQSRLSTVISKMDTRSARIINARYLTDEPKPLRELSEEFGVSIARVGQLEKRAVQMVADGMRKFVA